MPIQTMHPIEVFDQEQFHEVDRRVTGAAFDIHNEFGRFLDERIYQELLASRCLAMGFDVAQEFSVTASLDDFSKIYFVDQMINRGVIVETKAAQSIAPTHRGQVLNYLFLTGLQHASLINFRSERLEHEFVSTRLTQITRRQFDINLDQFCCQSAECSRLLDVLARLLNEWGAYLDPKLYRDALTHFLGGPEKVIQKVPITGNGKVFGKQEMRLLNAETAFAVSALTHDTRLVSSHERRLLEHTNLRAIHWINLNHSRIEVQTIQRSICSSS